MKVLEGIRVLEMSNFVSGPWAAQLLGEFGANVIKVERPGIGDPFRAHSPDNYSSTFCAHNRHKRSLTLDVTKTAGRDIFLKLAAKSDVVLENFRPGVMDKLCLGSDTLREINPRIIYCAITGFGPAGPYKLRPAYDTVIQAMGGLLNQSLMPEQPITGVNYADSIASLVAVQGILGALFDRERSGTGRRVDVPMIDAMISFLTNSAGIFFDTGKTPGPLYRPARSQCFVFKCADGCSISVHLSTPEKFWSGILKAIDKPELASDPRFSLVQNRIKNFQELGSALSPSFLKRPRADWERLLEQHDVPFAPVNDFADIVADPQIAYLQTFADIMHPTKGPAKNIARPIFYDGDRKFDASTAPLLGEHTDEILDEMGFAQAETAQLREAGII